LEHESPFVEQSDSPSAVRHWPNLGPTLTWLLTVLTMALIIYGSVLIVAVASGAWFG
jgi:hypothetical protein